MAVAVLVAAAALPLVAGQHLLTAMIVALHAAFMALAWNVAAGYAGQFSLGHSLFYGIGAYASTVLYLRLGLTPWAGMFAGAALAGVVGILLALGVYRYNVYGIFFALVTLGAAEVAKGLADNWDFIKGPVGILLTMQHAPGNFFFLRREPYYFVALAMLVAMILISLLLERSPLGQYFLAVREDEQAAEASGVNTYRYKTIAIGLSAALTAFAGSFYAQFYLYVSPETVFTFEPQLTMMLGTMVGGAGTAFGPVIGAMLFSGLGEALRNLPFFESTRRVVIGSKMVYAVLLIVVLHLPARRPHHARAQARVTAAMAALLEVQSVSKRFGGLQALSNVGFTVAEGEIVGIIGPNGAGKTTLFNVVTGVYPPDTGRVVFRGVDVTGAAPYRICKLGAARTFQISKPFAALTVLQTVRIGALNRIRDTAGATVKALEVLELMGLAGKRDELGRALTVIERKRLEMARALATQPSLLLLDEVAAGLRPNEVQEMIALVRSIAAGGVSVLIIEHVLEAVMRLSGRIVVLNYGEVIAEGRPDEMVDDPRVIEAYLGEAYSLA